MKIIAHLGYPPYFPLMTGTAKIVGAIVLVIPGHPIAKEWAYAGFGILLVSAFVSHLASGDGPLAIAPVVVFAVLVASYLLRPTGRRVIAA